MLSDPAEAQEALCEAYQRAWERIKSYNPAQCGLLAWLILLTRAVALERRNNLGPAALPPQAGTPMNRLFERLEPAARRTVESAFFEGTGGERENVRAAFGQLRSMLQKKGDTVQ